MGVLMLTSGTALADVVPIGRLTAATDLCGGSGARKGGGAREKGVEPSNNRLSANRSKISAT